MICFTGRWIGRREFAKEVAQLAIALAKRFGDEPIVLASLVRAGVPLGVMLHQALRDMGKPHGITVSALSGIVELDGAALDVIEERHGTSGIVFVDGSTGKGAITGELVRALKDRPGYPEQPRLVVAGRSLWLLLACSQ